MKRVGLLVFLFVLVACGGELGKKYYTLPPEAQDLRAGDNFRGIVRDQEGNVLACDGTVEILPEVGFERLIDAKYCIPGTRFATPTLLPTRVYTPTIVSEAIACAAAAEIVDSSLWIDINRSGLAQVLEDLGWCGKKVTIILLDVDRWEVGVAPLTEGDVIGFPVFPPEWIPEEGRKCGMKIEVDWLTFLNCVMLHELRHLQHFAEGRPEDDPTVEAEADAYALANFSRIWVVETEVEESHCGSRVTIRDNSRRASTNAYSLRDSLEELGLCYQKFTIELEDIDPEVTPVRDRRWGWVVAYQDYFKMQAGYFRIERDATGEEIPVIRVNIPRPIISYYNNYEIYGICGKSPGWTRADVCTLLQGLRRIWQIKNGFPFASEVDADAEAWQWAMEHMGLLPLYNDPEYGEDQIVIKYPFP